MKANTLRTVTSFHHALGCNLIGAFIFCTFSPGASSAFRIPAAGRTGTAARKTLSMSANPSKFVDCCVNLKDSMFQGIYHDKTKHAPDFDLVLERARHNGVEIIVGVSGSLQDSLETIEVAKAHPGIYATVGIHPTRVGELEASEDAEGILDRLAALAMDKSNKVVAIGEIGLDYDRTEFCPKEVQQKWFARLLGLADRCGLPVIYHNRNTAGDFERILTDHRRRRAAAAATRDGSSSGSEGAGRPAEAGGEGIIAGDGMEEGGKGVAAAAAVADGGVVHSFTGSKEEMEGLVAMGLCVGINGCGLKSPELLQMAAAIPLDHLVVETDAPWCDIRPTHAAHAHVKTHWETVKPEKFRPGAMVKNRTEPSHVIQVVEVLASIKGLPAAQVAAATRRNALVALRIPDTLAGPGDSDAAGEGAVAAA